jgi:hypothetical protein
MDFGWADRNVGLTLTSLMARGKIQREGAVVYPVTHDAQ